MATFIMYGKYSRDAVKEISAGRTEKALSVIKDLGGEVKSIYATLGKYDLVFIVDLPDTEKAVAASLTLFKLLGISFTTAPAVSVEKLDEISSNI